MSIFTACSDGKQHACHYCRDTGYHIHSNIPCQYCATFVKAEQARQARQARQAAYREIKTSATTSQVGGDHYKKLGHYQPWEVFTKWLTPEELRGFAKGTAIAYLAREKNGREDIEKAMHTLQLYLELSSGKE